MSDPSITLDNVIMEGYSKDSSVRDIITKLNESNNFDYVIDIYNTQNFESIFYFEKYTLLQNEFKTTVYDENKTALYNTVSSRSTTDLIPIEQVQQRASCFKTCFDAQEESFEDSFTGWLYWNVGPQAVAVQTMAALNCQGCCRVWWSNVGC